ncbi:AzlC family ABC transporter permease [Streptococcus mutans]|uniref:AzlC family ABC transporter permease n=1 Tax=Streptococcus mutans TaxID=1309 RepID=UPI001CFE6D5E|nr:AzlC family ABC transporter permease [Streptococcus mutans]MCB4930356.1 AzlC family ABC transporter permease [Streptococcus mutans]MCB5005792.1 AzlC family ABC transporter permease [Streptococcus mutans]MCB5028820.1 AzlC family ABC transporter permease [Streptococcus mutans]MCB5035858.1 AzlC family ABC transporter permease [Streptococcus mutans]
MQEKGFKEGVKASLPTALGYVSIGLACGVVGANSGLTPFQMGLMSLLVYAGSAQFVMCAMFVAGADLFSIVMTVFLINLRNFLMSLHATTIFTKSSLWQTICIGTLITDESYGVLLNEHVHHKNISTAWMYGNNITGYIAWLFAVILGTALGSVIPNPETLGLDFALIAMFVSIFESQLAAMMQFVKLKKIGLILLAVTLSYFLLVIVISESLAVLLSTLIGCFAGVLLDVR